ncbi:MAG: cobyrinate a,c-diamide synthase [Dermatophilaceae bacterium]
MVALPRLVVAAPSTGQGKTTVATGLMVALSAAGHAVSGHKVGPDFIDPGYHALATGRPGRNLDPHLVGEHRVAPLLLHGAAGADVAVIEGVMGLHDGKVGTDGFASTAHVAALTGSPVILVVDVGRMSRTAAAVAAGVAAFDPRVTVAGVVLNRAGSPRMAGEIRRALERVGLPVLGALPRDESLAAPSRHLGLVPAAERVESARMVQRLGEQVAQHLDLAAVLDLARAAPDLDAEPWDPAAEVSPPCADLLLGAVDVAVSGADSGTRSAAAVRDRPVVAVAGGRAFTFRYAETDELLRAAGCEVVVLDPLVDTRLPERTQGIYLGGGFPEVYADRLGANQALLADLARAVAAGVPTVAECAGLLYLARSLDAAPMAGVVPADAVMTERLTLRYPDAVAAGDGLLARTGERVTGHEFHRTTTMPVAGDRPAWVIDGQPTGFTTDTSHASYLHVHWAGYPVLAQRFTDAVHAAAPLTPTGWMAALAPTPRMDSPAPVAPANSTAVLPAGAAALADDGIAAVEAVVADPLRHHGDREGAGGLLDLAVNVYDGPRPAWLDAALHDAVDLSHRYPDAEPARAALARRYGRPECDILPTSGAAEAFSLVARLRAWRRPVVIHPQFTEPHAALEQAGHRVTRVLCRPEHGFALDPGAVPDDADLVIVGNPTNPTGVLHPAAALRMLVRPGRVLVVDEAFMDAVPGEAESLVGEAVPGLLVVRSLTKHWSIPGIRAGFVAGDAELVAGLAAYQSPWSVSTLAVAATVACATDAAVAEADRRARDIDGWREHLRSGLRRRGIEQVPSSAPFVLARPGVGVHGALRSAGVAVRRADTFPGLDDTWVRVAVRPPEVTDRFLTALDSRRVAESR